MLIIYFGLSPYFYWYVLNWLCYYVRGVVGSAELGTASTSSFSKGSAVLVLVLMCIISRHGKTGGSDRVNRVAGQNGSRVKTGQSGCGSNGSRVESGCELGRVDPYFSIFFFFEVDAICQLFISSLTIIRFSLVILSQITTKHLTWYPNLVQLDRKSVV